MNCVNTGPECFGCSDDPCIGSHSVECEVCVEGDPCESNFGGDDQERAACGLYRVKVSIAGETRFSAFMRKGQCTGFGDSKDAVSRCGGGGTITWVAEASVWGMYEAASRSGPVSHTSVPIPICPSLCGSSSDSSVGGQDLLDLPQNIMLEEQLW